MVQNAYAGGADTTGVGRRGRGNRGGNGRPNRGGGGGGGGNKLPKGGLYGGKAGEAAANQNPEAYLQAMFRNSNFQGMSPGTDWDTFLNDYATNELINAYQSGQEGVAKNQRQSIEDWMKANYGGAGFHGKKGKDFNAGTLGDSLQGMYGTWSANQNPLTHAITTANQQGLIASNGNDAFQQWYQQTYAPQLEAQWRTAQRADPKLNFDAFMASQDPEAARRAFAFRSPQQRQMTGQPVGGRWSWWS